MVLNQAQANNQEVDDELISFEECKKYLGNFGLCDQRIIEIRDSLIGIVNKTLDSYVESFEK